MLRTNVEILADIANKYKAFKETSLAKMMIHSSHFESEDRFGIKETEFKQIVESLQNFSDNQNNQDKKINENKKLKEDLVHIDYYAAYLNALYCLYDFFDKKDSTSSIEKAGDSIQREEIKIAYGLFCKIADDFSAIKDLQKRKGSIEEKQQEFNQLAAQMKKNTHALFKMLNSRVNIPQKIVTGLAMFGAAVLGVIGGVLLGIPIGLVCSLIHRSPVLALRGLDAPFTTPYYFAKMTSEGMKSRFLENKNPTFARFFRYQARAEDALDVFKDKNKVNEATPLVKK